MNINNSTLFDTDMFIHQISPDAKVRNASQAYFSENRPTAMCSLSLLELKGNYIQDLALLYKKSQ
jgi:hypothetical protein